VHHAKILRLPTEEINLKTKLNLVIICMGTGVTPFISILERILATPMYLHNVKVQMYYGVRNDAASFYYQEFLTKFFKTSNQLHGSQLTLACSRQISNHDKQQGIVKTSGYVTKAVSEIPQEEG